MNLIVLKFAICDDIDSVCEYIEEFLVRICKEKNLSMEYDTFYSGDEFISALNKNVYDCIFLDIEIGSTNGIEVSKYLREKQNNETTEIIYISQHTQYAVNLFDYDPITFLLKPFNDAMIMKAFNKFLKRINIGEEVFPVKIGYDIKRIPIKDILYFESSDHKILLHTSTAVDSFYDKIDNILSKVNPKTFIQIHKSIIVNKMHIKRFYYDSIELDNDETLPISQSRRKYVRLSILEE